MPRRGVRILPAHQATRMTIFSASEEKWVENDILHAKMYFNMPYALKTAGGEVINGSVDFEPHVIADRELITGQNPRSDHPIAAKLIEALAHREGRAAALSQADVDKESLKLRV